MNHAYASLNKAILNHWEQIAPDVPVYFERPQAPNFLPADCLLVEWPNIGIPTSQPNEEEADIRLHIFGAGYGRETLLSRASQLDEAFGFKSDGGFGDLGRFDWTDVENPVYLTSMRLVPRNPGWFRVPDKAPGGMHLCRYMTLQYLVN